MLETENANLRDSTQPDLAALQSSAALVSEISDTQPSLNSETEKSKNSVDFGDVAQDFGKSFVQTAVINPLWNGLGQLVSLGHLPQVHIDNPENAQKSDASAWAQTIGGAVGIAADFFILHKAKTLMFGESAVVQKAASLKPLQRIGHSFAENAALGAFYGAVFTPSEPGKNLFFGRLANAGSEGLTFGVLGGATGYLGHLKSLSGVRAGTISNVVSDVAIAGVAGLPAGAVGAVAHSAFNGRSTSIEEIASSAAEFGVVGAALAGITHGAARFMPNKTVSSPGEGPVVVENTGKANDTPAKSGEKAKSSKPIVSFEVVFRKVPGSSKTSVDALGAPSISSEQTMSNLKSHPSGLDVGALARVYTEAKELAGRMKKEGTTIKDWEDIRATFQELDSKPAYTTLPPSQFDGRFIPERASRLDNAQLVTVDNVAEYSGVPHGDRVLEIKRFLNQEGEDAQQYLAKVISENDLTVIGETHTNLTPSPHRILSKDVIEKLPAGSTLAVEMESSLKPVFDEFNSVKGSEFRLDPKATDSAQTVQDLLTLRLTKRSNPDLFDLFKAARDKGIRIVPIDAGQLPAIEREKWLATELIKAFRERDSKPVVAWIGAYHASRSGGTNPTMTEIVSQMPEFRDSKNKISTVFGVGTEIDTMALIPSSVISRHVIAPVAVPTGFGSKPTPISNIPMMASRTDDGIRLGHFNHVMFFPQSTLKQNIDYQIRRLADDAERLTVLEREAKQLGFAQAFELGLKAE